MVRWIGISNLLSRTIGPFWMIHAYFDFGSWILFLFTGILFVVSLIVTSVWFSALTPFKADGLGNIDDSDTKPFAEEEDNHIEPPPSNRNNVLDPE